MQNTEKQSRTFVYGGVVVAVLAVLYIIGAQMAGRAQVGSVDKAGATAKGVEGVMALVPREAFYDFGSISMARGVVTKEFVVTNTSTEPATLERIWTSCMCTTAELVLPSGYRSPTVGMPGHGSVPRLAAVIAPGEEARVAVHFDPAAHGPAGVGLIERSIYLADESGKQVELKFRAVVTP